MEEVSRVYEQKAQHPGISMGIVQSISKLLDNHQLEDFEVTVEGAIFSCHSCILASCSEFFNGLLRSNMKEKREMKVQLSNISSPIFQLILKTLYTGMDLLTTTNVLEVWSAVHQLQIQFLIQHCEDFVMNNLSVDNLEMYKEHAEYLHSEKVCDYSFNFILRNFSTVRDKELFLHLDFQYLTKLFQSDKLVVSSEDEVLISIFDWVKYGNSLTNKLDSKIVVTSNEAPEVLLNSVDAKDSTQNLREPNREPNRETLDLSVNSHFLPNKQQNNSITDEEPNERKKFLCQLLNTTRYYLASESCIFSLYNNKLIQDDILVKESLLEACTFKFCKKWHNYCPPKAILRDSWGIEHVGVCCEEGFISALSFKREKWSFIKCSPYNPNGKLTRLKGKLYACSTEGTKIRLIGLHKSNKWVLKAKISHAVDMFLALGHFIYMFHFVGQKMTKFNAITSQIKVETITHTIDNIAHALVYNNSIVVFCSLNSNGVEETAVHSWNTDTNVWTTFDNLQLCSENLTSFCNDRDTYILECNGTLWKLTNSETFQFIVVAKLWSGKYVIKGALLFRESLFIFGHFPNDEDKDTKIEVLDGVFTSARFWNVALTASNLAHHAIPIDDLHYYGL